MDRDLVTTYSDVVERFAGAESAQTRLQAWRADPDKSSVVPFVENSRTTVLYATTPEEVLSVCDRTEHALGTVTSEVAKSVRAIVDWHPSFAFEHVLNHAEETLGCIPTYQEPRSFVVEDDLARTMLLEPAWAAVRAVGTAEARASMRWRVANAYLAHLKQAYVMAVLREEGIDARYHVLADVLFRVDFWIEDVCVALYVGNSLYRAGRAGRKTPAVDIVGPSFRHVTLELATRHEFGTVHLPDRDAILSSVRGTGD